MKTIEEIKEFIKLQIEFNKGAARRDCKPHIILNELNYAYNNLLKFIGEKLENTTLINENTCNCTKGYSNEQYNKLLKLIEDIRKLGDSNENS